MTHVVVTGASRGIGLGLARAFLREGCRVTISAREQAAVERALQDLASDTGNDSVAGLACDVSSAEQVQALLEFAERAAPVDIWVNNAGRNLAPISYWELDLAEIADLVSTNLGGVMLGTRAALRAMVKRGHGKIYNLEGFGANGGKLRGFAPYGATKVGVRYVTQALAREAKHTGVLLATVDPGVVATDAMAELYPALRPWLKPFVRALAQPIDAVCPCLARLMLANRRTGVCIRVVGVARAVMRLVLGLLGTRGEVRPPDTRSLPSR